jgi:hypothetical protein
MSTSGGNGLGGRDQRWEGEMKEAADEKKERSSVREGNGGRNGISLCG